MIKLRELLRKHFTQPGDRVDRFKEETPLSDMLPKFANEGRVLDVGCGRGWFMSRLRSKGYEVVGVDTSPPRLKEASKWGAVIIASADRLPFSDNSFDIVVCLAVLHHLRNPWQALDEMHRVVKNEGIIYIAEVTEDNPINALLRNIFPYWDGDPVLTRVTRSYLSGKLTERGFQILLENCWGGNIYWIWMTLVTRWNFLHKLTPIVRWIENQVDKNLKGLSCTYHVIARKMGRSLIYNTVPYGHGGM